MSLSLVMAKIKHYNLKEYKHMNPIIFVEAKDPDEACYKATNMFMSIILDQDNSIETIGFLKDLLHDIRVIKIESP